jgi:hypothetical protein
MLDRLGHAGSVRHPLGSSRRDSPATRPAWLFHDRVHSRGWDEFGGGGIAGRGLSICCLNGDRSRNPAHRLAAGLRLDLILSQVLRLRFARFLGLRTNPACR